MFSPATYKTLFMSRAKKGKWGQNILESYSYFQGLALKVDNSKHNLYSKLPIIVYIPFSFGFRGIFREQINNATMTVLNSQ